MLFGQFVGDWDVLESRHLDDGGRWVRRTGEVHWRWILGGRAVQDVWLFRRSRSARLAPVGTTIRFFHTGKKAWQSLWIAPGQDDAALFIGRKVGDEIVLELEEASKHEGEGDLKWIFYDVKRSSFSWRAEEYSDRSKKWVLKQEMKLARRGRTRSGGR